MGEDEAADAVRRAVEAHPVLSMCIAEIDGEPWMVPGRRPVIERDDGSPFVRPFVLSESLCRFRILPDRIMWDVHHCIMDAE